MEILEVLVCIKIIVIEFVVLYPDIELGLMRAVSNIGVYKGIN